MDVHNQGEPVPPPNSTDPVIKPKRTRKWSVPLWVLMLFIAVVGAFLAIQISKARAQREAVAAINSLGGRVSYDYEYASGDIITGDFERVTGTATHRAPTWLREALGDEYFQRVAVVRFHSTSIQKVDVDQILNPVAKLGGLPLLQLALHPQEGRDEGRSGYFLSLVWECSKAQFSSQIWM